MQCWCDLKNSYCIKINVLTTLYYSLIYPYLTYGIAAQGNSYSSTTNPSYKSQK